MPCPQARYWILTIPENSWQAPEALPPTMVYIRGQKERGEGDSGYVHWQVCVGFSQKKTLLQCKTIFSRDAHCEPTRSAAANTYVCKEETRIEGTEFAYGEMPIKRNSKEDWTKVKENAIAGKLDDIPDDIFIRHYNTLKNIRADYEQKPLDLEDVCGLWIWGEAGSGKSTKARTYGEYFSKPLTKWWTGFKNEPIVIVEDLDNETAKHMAHFLKIWGDKYSFIGNIHGSSKHLRPQKIIVTSNYKIEQLYGQDRELTEAIKRRYVEEELIKNF